MHVDGWFQYKSLKFRKEPQQLDFYDQKLKNIDNIFLNSTDHFPHLLILTNFHLKSTVTNNVVYGRNYWFFNNNKFKNG